MEKDRGTGAGVSSSVLEWGPKLRGHRISPAGEELWRPYALHGVKRTSDDDNSTQGLHTFLIEPVGRILLFIKTVTRVI